MAAAQRFFIVLALVVAASVLSFRTIYEPDLGWHLAQGREDAAGRLVRTNVFSAPFADYRQHYTSWLFDSGIYAAWTAGGDTAVQALQAALLAAMFFALYRACRVRSGVAPAIAVSILAFLVVEPRAMPRPHVMSFAAFAVVAWLIERAKDSRRSAPLLWAIPLAALWSNTHTESVFGVLMLGAFAAAEFVRPAALTRHEAVRALGITAASAAALLLNPYGWGLFAYLYENATVPGLLGIAELQPAYLPVYRAFFAYVVIAALFLAIGWRRATLADAAALVIFAALGARYLRLTPIVVFATAPVLALRLTEWTRRGLDGRALVVTAAAAAIVLSRIPLPALVRGVDAGTLHPPSVFSPSAERFIRDEQLTGPVFNSHNLGGWLAWTQYPAVRIFQDSRLQAYPPDHFRRILDASRSQAAWDDLLEGLDWAVLSRARENILSGAGRFPVNSWASVFFDDAIEIVVRRDGRYAELASERGYEILSSETELYDLAPRLRDGDRSQLRMEAERNRTQNPEGFTAAAILCLEGEADACDAAERIAARWPSLEDDLALLKVLKQ